MCNLWRITFTGIDERCDLATLTALAETENRLEFGILYGGTSTHPHRYPGVRWINKSVPALKKAGVHLALHVCGTEVDRLLQIGELAELPVWSRFDRIQLNRQFDPAMQSGLKRHIEQALPPFYITQFDLNPTLHHSGLGTAHQVLFDASAGRGVLRSNWPAPLPSVRCGYAGGLSPENLPEVLPAIQAAAGNRHYWIDMESGVRDPEDYFSVARARHALAAIHTVERTG